MPEPGPVGVKVEPLGEPLGDSVLPDGFVVVFGPVERPAVVEPGALPVVLPLTDEPAVEPVAAEPPAAEPAPAAPPLWANANVLERANAPANAIVVSFIGCFPLLMMERKPAETPDVPPRPARRFQRVAMNDGIDGKYDAGTFTLSRPMAWPEGVVTRCSATHPDGSLKIALTGKPTCYKPTCYQAYLPSVGSMRNRHRFQMRSITMKLILSAFTPSPGVR